MSQDISEMAVKAALDALLYGPRPRSPNPLEALSLVDEALIDSTLPRAEHLRAYLLAQILIAILVDELNGVRQALGLAIVELDAPLGRVLETITIEAQLTNPVLLGWSWLYVHYVRVDLNLDARQFCRLVCINERTLQRYRQQAISRLTGRLIDREWIARKRHLRRRLVAQLPNRRSPAFYGRHELLAKVAEMISRAETQHVQVVGARGVGKTAFVQQAIARLIDGEAIDHLLWLDGRKTVPEIRHRLLRFLREQERFATLREFIVCQRAVFVLDGVDFLGDDCLGLEQLLDELGSAPVLLTACVPLPLRQAMGYVILPELDPMDAKPLIRGLLNQWCYRSHDEVMPEEIELVWQQAGGNPRRIVEAVCALQTPKTVTRLA